jgi:hypothetical protein
MAASKEERPDDRDRDATSGDGSEQDPVFERVVGEIAEAAEHLRVLAGVRSDRARLRVRRTIQRARRRILVWIALGAFALCGAALLAIGLAGALSAAFGDRPWLGQLTAGVVLLGGVAIYLTVRRVRIERAHLNRLRGKYDDPEPNPTGPRSDGSADPSGRPRADGRGTPRPSGSAGAHRSGAQPEDPPS